MPTHESIENKINYISNPLLNDKIIQKKYFY